MTRTILFAVALLLSAPSALARDYTLETVVSGLEHPWSLAFLPDGRMLVTERAGRLRVVDDGVLLDEPVAGVPEAYVASQGGLFEVLPDPDFEDNGLIYLSLAHGSARANRTRVVRGRLDDHRLEDVEVIFDSVPDRSTPVHYGGRMTFLGDGSLVVGLGDGFNYREQAQDRTDHLGAVVRIQTDGSVPEDNPFVDDPDTLPEIYSYGHRNVQGLVFDERTGTLWQHEHGPRGGDELNRVEPGANYGWPVITHGIDYSGARVSPYREFEGMQSPLIDWTPAIAPAGMTLYRGEQFPGWQGNLLIAGLVARAVIRVEIGSNGPEEVERLFGDLDQRIRDVRTGPDGAVWLLTDHADGKLVRVTAR